MNETEFKKLDKLADFLRESVPRKAFNFGEWMRYGEKEPLEALAAGGGCGTVGCAVGWMPACFPGEVRWTKPKPRYYHAGGRSTVVLSVEGTSLYAYRQHGSIGTAMKFFGLTRSEARTLFVPAYSYLTPENDATPAEVAKHIKRFLAAKRRLGLNIELWATRNTSGKTMWIPYAV